MFKIKNLEVSLENKKILKGINLTIKKGEVVFLMGPNGSGKSTLGNTIMGNPDYKVDKGSISLLSKSILKFSPDKRAKLGLFLSFQYPLEIQGLTFSKFLHAAYKNHYPLDAMSLVQFRKKLKEAAKELEISEDFIDRELNVGFSGGEKKRAEILQMKVLKPKIAILDETDSGLDIDSLKLVANNVDRMRSKDFGAIVITHYKRILNYLKPDFVHIMYDGKIVKSGGIELADELEEKGYSGMLKEAGVKMLEVKE
ncbi:Fe-S cluster assembly ATPase SufC [archaeon]|nr:Fe-S cluster assembly ATPase SufC [archaeon]